MQTAFSQPLLPFVSRHTTYHNLAVQAMRLSAFILRDSLCLKLFINTLIYRTFCCARENTLEQRT